MLRVGQLAECSVVDLPEKDRKDDARGGQGDDDDSGHLDHSPNGHSARELARDHLLKDDTLLAGPTKETREQNSLGHMLASPLHVFLHHTDGEEEEGSDE